MILFGGAARAAYLLHRSLKNIGVDSQILVQDKQSDDYTAIAPGSKVSKSIGKLTPTLHSLPLRIYSLARSLYLLLNSIKH